MVGYNNKFSHQQIRSEMICEMHDYEKFPLCCFVISLAFLTVLLAYAITRSTPFGLCVKMATISVNEAPLVGVKSSLLLEYPSIGAVTSWFLNFFRAFSHSLVHSNFCYFFKKL